MMEGLIDFRALALLADLIGMISIILASYILVLNPRQRTNQLACLMLAILAVNTIATSGLFRADTYQDAYLPSILMAAFVPAIGPSLILATFAMIKPAWLSGKGRWLLSIFLILVFLPGFLTLIDTILGTSTYFIRPDSQVFSGSFIQPSALVSPLVGLGVLYTGMMGLNGLLIIIFLYLGFFDRTQDKRRRDMARMLLVAQLVAMAFYSMFSFGNLLLSDGVVYLIVLIIFIIAYSISALQHLIASRGMQVGRLQNRLTMLMVVIVVPVLIFVSTSLIRYTGEHIEEDANETMEIGGEFLVTLIDSWLDENIRFLENMASQPDIISMDPARQKPALEVYAQVYDYMYLISTTDLTGLNVARNDSNPPLDYKDRLWFQGAASGAPLTFQTLIGRTTGKPALVASVPIYSPPNDVIGVAMFASYLTSLSDQVLKVRMGETGYAYLIDDQNQLIAHPDLQPISTELVNFSEAAPVQALREGVEPPIVYTDEDGIVWRAYYTLLDNNWAVVLQQQEIELFRAYRELQSLSWMLMGGGGLVMLMLVWASMRQAVQPINTLTQTVKDIAAGNLERVAVVESEDEIGTLAQAFNIMTNQVRSLVGSLEQRVAERTLDLEHRSAQLQAAAEVGRAAATIRNLDELLLVVIRLISERFGFYHVGIFLLDEHSEYAHLRAANSPGGQRMLARGHKLRVGQQGIVGYVTAHREPRVALNVGEDTAFFNNPELPDTQSEMALPLLVGGELLGVLDVQSVHPNAFTDQDVETLQVLADQVAIAINSSQLLQRTEALLESERRSSRTITSNSWLEQFHAMENVGFLRERSGLRPVTSVSDPQMQTLLQSGQIVIDQSDPFILYVPVRVRDQVIGILKLVHDRNGGGWSDDDIGIMRILAEQLGVALESARAYQQTQMGAQRDRILGEISSRIRETLDIQTILRTATQEVRQVLDLSKVVVRVGAPPNEGGNGKSETSGGDHV